MGIGISIVDRLRKHAAEVDVSPGERNALIVATRDLKEYEGFLQPVFNPLLGIDMNVNAAYSGTPEHVHDGTDNAYWTGTAISGVKFTFNSALQNHTPAGSKSVWSNRSVTGDTAQFAKGSSLDLSGYIAITFWIYIVDNWAAGDSVSIYGWDTGAASMVGTPVSIENYMESGTFGKWQKIAIPFEQMNLVGETIDALRLEVDAISGLPPSFFIDDIQIEELGTPAIFSVAPDPGTWLWVVRQKIVIAAAYDAILTDGTVPNLSFDDLLGVSVANGIVYTERSNGQESNFAIRQLSDVVQLPSIPRFGAVCDGTNTMLWVETNSYHPVPLKYEENDRISYIIQDDFSGFLLARVFVEGGIERR